MYGEKMRKLLATILMLTSTLTFAENKNCVEIKSKGYDYIELESGFKLRGEDVVYLKLEGRCLEKRELYMLKSNSHYSDFRDLDRLSIVYKDIKNKSCNNVFSHIKDSYQKAEIRLESFGKDQFDLKANNSLSIENEFKTITVNYVKCSSIKDAPIF